MCFHRAFQLFQFTPLREGRLKTEAIHRFMWVISIHAPPRGATKARLATAWHPYFNSRPSARGDPPLTQRRKPSKFQFTPLREGRPLSGSRHPQPENFNSRPSARGDGYAQLKPQGTSYFNSRPSARGDAADLQKKEDAEYFNSRPSARGDDESDKHKRSLFISIHAPPRGATCLRWR